MSDILNKSHVIYREKSAKMTWQQHLSQILTLCEESAALDIAKEQHKNKYRIRQATAAEKALYLADDSVKEIAQRHS